MTAKPLLGYKELTDCSDNISSVSSNNSPLLRRLQITKIKHLLSFKSKISPMGRDIDINAASVQSATYCASPEHNGFQNKQISCKSLPSSPMRIRIPKPSCLTPPDTSKSVSPRRLRLSDPSLHQKIHRRVKSALSLPRNSLNSPSINEKPLQQNSCTNSVTSLNGQTKNSQTCPASQEENHTEKDDSNTNNQPEWQICYHPIDEIRDVVLVRDSNKRFGIKLDRTTCGEQITYIVMVLPGSVAQKSGLKVGDQIIRVDGFYVHQISMETLVDYIRAKNDAVRIFYKARSLLVRTKVIHLQKENNRFGLRLIRRVQGVFVDYVIPDSAADKANLKEGDQLLKINNTDVSQWSQERATHLLKHSNQTLILHVYDATFAANDCLHQKNIFFDCNNWNESDSFLSPDDFHDDSEQFDSDLLVPRSFPNSPQRSLMNELKNQC